MTIQTLELIRDLMRQIALSPAEEDFVSKAEKVIQAWKEVEEAIGKHSQDTSEV